MRLRTRRASLHTALRLNFVLAAVGPLLVVGLLSWSVLSRSMAADVAQKNLLLAQALAAEVAQFLESPLRVLEHIGDAVERQIVPVDRLDAYLASVARTYALFEMLMLIDPNGRVTHLAPDSPDFRGLDMSGQPFFRHTPPDRQPYWSPTFIALHTGNPTMTVSLACQSGIVVGYIDLTVLNELVAKLTIATSGYAGILDRDGTVIAHPDRALVWQRVNLLTPDISQGRQGRAGAFTYVVAGQARLGSVAMVPHTRWFVTVSQPVAEAYAPIRRMRAMLFSGLAGALGLALAIAVLSARAIARPLSRLTRHTRQIAAGQYHCVPPARQYLELDELAADFNRMARAIDSREAALRAGEQEIRALNATLESRVARRTAELETANQELRSFAYVVSHDLKAPLRGISRLATWLVEDYADRIDDEGRRMAALLIGRVQRLDNLIEGILQYSRVGRAVADFETIDPNELLDDVLDSLAPPDHIRIEIAPHLPAIVGERVRITQVFQNLISNAVKFMDRADGRITIDGEEHETACTFRVADNGPGIDPQYHERIFRIFQTLRPRDEEENTGIGLAIVKKIIDLYGGAIRVESQPGEGSAFVFTLPKQPRRSSIAVSTPA